VNLIKEALRYGTHCWKFHSFTCLPRVCSRIEWTRLIRNIRKETAFIELRRVNIVLKEMIIWLIKGLSCLTRARMRPNTTVVCHCCLVGWSAREWPNTTMVRYTAHRPYSASVLPSDAVRLRGICYGDVAVCVSVTLMYCAQTTESIIMRFSPDCSPTILVFPHQTR